MPLTPSQKPTREWPLLILTLGLVGLICFPLWQGLGGDPFEQFNSWDEERWARLLLGPEQIACYCCFLWAGFILISRALEVRRQRQGFHLGFLPTEEGARILKEDTRPLQRKINQITARKGPFILANMARVALAKFGLSRNGQDVTEAIRTQAEVDQGRLVSSMSTINYLAWAIPAIGFFGTVRGLAGSMTLAEQGGEQIRMATRHLTVAFDCTLIALGLSLIVMFFVHVMQREEDALVIDCQQFCLEHLINRVYEPEAIGEAGPPLSPVLRHNNPTFPGSLTETYPP